MLPAFTLGGRLAADASYFRFRDATCYGRWTGNGQQSREATLVDTSGQVEVSPGRVALPFDLEEIVINLRHERYPRQSVNTGTRFNRAASKAYYWLRPALGVGARKHLQRLGLRSWRRISFPEWPVDLGVDNLMRGAMELALGGVATERVPFIWFWPDGAPSATIVTHDVEQRAGQRFCDQLMDIDDGFGIKSSFQLVPEGRYTTTRMMFERFRCRGFEANIHDLNHGGRLFDTREHFRKHAARISAYAREFGSRGFRTGSMYREQDWFDALDIGYDMSVPNVAHMEPQRGGCCTVMPYFNGSIVELPLTTVQDYSLFHVLGDYSTSLWRQQIERIRSRNGLIAILTHPDYLTTARPQLVYKELLGLVERLRRERRTWVALPGEVADWWRSRHALRIVRNGAAWRIEGAGRERARLAYAVLRDGRLAYEFETAA